MPDSAPPYKLVIHWFRRDLRISDNTALNEAAQSEAVLPVYVQSDWSGSHLWTGPKRQKFLCDALESLDRNLGTIDSRLIVRRGDAVEELTQLARQTNAEAIYANLDPDPYGKETEEKLQRACDELGITLHLHQDVMFFGPDAVLKDDGHPYRVYTPYSRKWLNQEFPPVVDKPVSLKTPKDVDSLPLPTLSDWDIELEPNAAPVEAGEKAARDRLRETINDVIATYDDTRDIPSIRGTSRLSQDLRFGTISIRTVFHAAMAEKAKASSKASEQIHKYIKELAWRDFYMQILHYYPEVLELEFNPAWRGLDWDEPGEQFDAWKEGRTGFPIIDAGIRELLATGYMHNRVRMIVAMFLTKDLHIDWRLGEQFFMQHLTDGEIASNNGGWQWSAGTGADAAPYFRIQNPWTQSKRFDAKGEYIKKWVPELENVSAKKLYEAPTDGQPIAPGYPLPIVDHSTERDRTLAIFKKHKEQAGQ